MLGRLRMSVDNAIEHYDVLAKKVFSDGKKYIGYGKFKATALENFIKGIVKDETGNPDSKMIDPSSDGQCRTFVSPTTDLL